jgi:hypothetical protein
MISLQSNLFRQFFPQLPLRQIPNVAQVINQFYDLGWTNVDVFSMRLRFPETQNEFTQSLPRLENIRRHSELLDLKNRYFLSEMPKPDLSRTFVFQKLGDRK